MSNRFLADCDAVAHSLFADAGIADTGTYNAMTAGAVDVPARVMVDEAQQLVGDFGRVPGKTASITLLRADVPSPASGARVTVQTFDASGAVVGSETWELDRPIQQDTGSTVWEAARVY